MDVREEIKSRAKGYLDGIPELSGRIPSPLLIDFAIEEFGRMAFFSSDTDEYKEKILKDNISTIAFAVCGLISKIGGEGELSHTEAGISRVWEDAGISKTYYGRIGGRVKAL